jgi:hypothetical protein
MRRFLAVLRSFFHSSLSYTFSCHSSPPTTLQSSLTSSCHLFLGLPLDLLVSTTVQKLVPRSPRICAPQLVYSSVGIAIRYGQDGPGIESQWGREFTHPSTPALGPIQPPVQQVPALCLGGKAAGAWCCPLAPSSAEVKEKVELYLYCSSGPSWPVLRQSLP